MTGIDRRSFLRTSTTAAASGLFLAPSLSGLIACANPIDPASPARDLTLRKAKEGEGGYGELVPSDDVGGIISLPQGFHATILSTAGDAMIGGTVPYAPDGMAAFAIGSHRIRLIRNHELRDVPPVATPFGSPAYDEKGPGGTTTLEVTLDRDGRAALVRQFGSLAGTFTNCAGGPTPWGSWITCEETVAGPQNATGGSTGWQQTHGYNFEVPVTDDGFVTPVPLKAMGRFEHEALAVDPRTGWVYETEDHTPSGFYRFIPKVRGRLAAGGKLQALAIQGVDGYDTRTNQSLLTPLKVRWVTIDQPFSDDPFLPESFVFNQGLAKGAAKFARLEGCWYGDGSIYFNATSGGNAGAGQVWQYHIESEKLRLIFESPSFDVLNSPDNITVSPRGGIVICEDGEGTNYVRGLTPRGEVFDLVRNNANGSEWAGACWSPQGRTLFVNMQGETRPLQNPAGVKGMTFAIWGPWESGAL